MSRTRRMVQLKCDVSEDCSICLESMLHRRVTYLPCGHRFHLHCFVQQRKSMYESANVCALCRAPYCDKREELQWLREFSLSHEEVVAFTLVFYERVE